MIRITRRMIAFASIREMSKAMLSGSISYVAHLIRRDSDDHRVGLAV